MAVNQQLITASSPPTAVTGSPHPEVTQAGSLVTSSVSSTTTATTATTSSPTASQCHKGTVHVCVCVCVSFCK